MIPAPRSDKSIMRSLLDFGGRAEGPTSKHSSLEMGNEVAPSQVSVTHTLFARELALTRPILAKTGTVVRWPKEPGAASSGSRDSYFADGLRDGGALGLEALVQAGQRY